MGIMCAPTRYAAGVLPFFDEGRTILLGKEYRAWSNEFCWGDFGGKLEQNETLAECALREAIEETAGTLNITISQIIDAESRGHYVDMFHKNSGLMYRMYCILFEGEKPDIAQFKKNAEIQNGAHTEKIEWKYFNTRAVIYNRNGHIPTTKVKLYKPFQRGLNSLKKSSILSNFRNSLNA